MVECRGASCGGELSRVVILGPPGGRVLQLSTEDGGVLYTEDD